MLDDHFALQGCKEAGKAPTRATPIANKLAHDNPNNPCIFDLYAALRIAWKDTDPRIQSYPHSGDPIAGLDFAAKRLVTANYGM